MLQTLTEEELHTLERNLCISQDVELPVRADAPAPPALAPAEPRRADDTPIVDDGKIQVTDLSGAKEVDFEKE